MGENKLVVDLRVYERREMAGGHIDRVLFSDQGHVVNPEALLPLLMEVADNLLGQVMDKLESLDGRRGTEEDDGEMTID